MILTATQLDQLGDLARRAATILDDSRRHEEVRRREAEITATRAEAAARARELSALIGWRRCSAAPSILPKLFAVFAVSSPR
jgi:hypothetical protein